MYETKHISTIFCCAAVLPRRGCETSGEFPAAGGDRRGGERGGGVSGAGGYLQSGQISAVEGWPLDMEQQSSHFAHNLHSHMYEYTNVYKSFGKQFGIILNYIHDTEETRILPFPAISNGNTVSQSFTVNTSKRNYSLFKISFLDLQI
jgi:hypothetical protein